MKAKICRNKSLSASTDYVFSHGEPVIVSSNMAADTPDGLKREFAAVRRQRNDIAAPCLHIPLSLPPGDRLTSEQWDDFIGRFCDRMGIPQDCQKFAVRHSDTDCEHVHLVIDRLTPDGRCWDWKNTVYHAINACAALEQELPYLDETQQRKQLGNVGLSRAEHQREKIALAHLAPREMPQRKQLAQRIRRIVRSLALPTPQAFISAAAAAGIEARPNITLNAGKRHMCGFSFRTVNGHEWKFSGSKVGATWRTLAKAIGYNAQRDDALLYAAAQAQGADERSTRNTEGNMQASHAAPAPETRETAPDEGYYEPSI